MDDSMKLWYPTGSADQSAAVFVAESDVPPVLPVFVRVMYPVMLMGQFPLAPVPSVFGAPTELYEIVFAAVPSKTEPGVMPAPEASAVKFAIDTPIEMFAVPSNATPLMVRAVCSLVAVAALPVVLPELPVVLPEPLMNPLSLVNVEMLSPANANVLVTPLRRASTADAVAHRSPFTGADGADPGAILSPAPPDALATVFSLPVIVPPASGSLVASAVEIVMSAVPSNATPLMLRAVCSLVALPALPVVLPVPLM